jgi:S-adenosylmethionine synthetase
VTEGHPDKMADQISDAILDDLLGQDPQSRVAIETLLTTGQVHVAGEVTTSGFADVMQIVRSVVLDIGYDDSKKGFDGNSCGISVSIGKQSPDISQGVTTAFETRINASVDPLDTQGAGDQGLMFGYAAVDTEDLMPLPIDMAHQLAKRLADIRKSGVLAYLRPDGKTQVTIEYDGNSAIRLDTVVVSSQHDDVVSQETLRQGIIAEVVRPVLAQSDWQNLDVSNPQVLVNPTGRFVTGGPMGDAGLTGRKIIVDTYGGMARHGGGAFSGKDPSKVDRSAAYAMRWVAKNVVASGLATRCEVQIAYAIGKAQPVGIFVETYGTSVVPEEQIGEAILQVFDLRPAAIVRDLQLLDTALVHYRPTSTYGHFGRKEISYQRLVPGIPWESERVTVEIPWERTDRKDALAASVRG